MTRIGDLDDTLPFVLVRPQMGENIGAAARAMLNFGLTQMRLVAPRDGWANPAATAMASGAGRILDHAEVFDDTEAAVADAHYVYATTARPRDLKKRVLTPTEAALEAHARRQAGERVVILFGPERAGLENVEIARANAIVSVPVNPDFASLNLAQSVLLMAYEWRRAAINPQASMPETARAPQHEITRLGDHFEAQLEEAGFFFPEAKAANMKLNLRNLWSRLPLSSTDTQIFHGILRQMVRWKNRQ